MAAVVGAFLKSLIFQVPSGKVMKKGVKEMLGQYRNWATRALATVLACFLLGMIIWTLHGRVDTPAPALWGRGLGQ